MENFAKQFLNQATLPPTNTLEPLPQRGNTPAIPIRERTTINQPFTTIETLDFGPRLPVYPLDIDFLNSNGINYSKNLLPLGDLTQPNSQVQNIKKSKTLGAQRVGIGSRQPSKIDGAKRRASLDASGGVGLGGDKNLGFMRVSEGLVIPEEACETEEERGGGLGEGSSFGESGVSLGIGMFGVEKSSDGGLSIVICGNGTEAYLENLGMSGSGLCGRIERGLVKSAREVVDRQRGDCIMASQK
jgi:hypothetical protein